MNFLYVIDMNLAYNILKNY